MTKAHFHSTKRIIKPLKLIHSGICDLKFVRTRGGKKYFITFINDCTRYCYVYLPKSKDGKLKCLSFIKKRLKINLAQKLRQ